MRRIYYVFPKIQYPITFTWAVSVVVEFILLGVIIYATEKLTPHLNSDVEVYVRFGALVGVILVFTVVNLTLATRLTHKVAGPLVQIKRTLDQARRGDYSARVTMRSDDCMHDIGHAINLVLQGLDESKKVLMEINSSFQVPAGADSNRTKQMLLSQQKESIETVKHGIDKTKHVEGKLRES